MVGSRFDQPDVRGGCLKYGQVGLCSSDIARQHTNFLVAEQPPAALRIAKALLKNGQSASYDTLMEMSAAAQALAHLTDDHHEGVNALLEKRTPVFKGA